MATLTSLGFRIFSTYDGSGLRRARADLSTLNNTINRTNGGLNSFTGRLGALTSAAIAVGPALLPIGEAAIAAGGGLTALGVTAGSAAGLYAVAAGYIITRTLEMMENNEKLSAAQKRFAQGVGEATSAWNKLLVAMEPRVLAAARDAVDGVTAGIKQLAPVMSAVQPIVTNVAMAFRKWMQDSEMGFGRFIDAVLTHGIPALNNLVAAGRDILATLGIAFRTLLPLVIPLSEKIREGAAALREWAEGGGFQRFLDRVRENAPAVLAFFAAAVAAFRNMMDAIRILAPLSLQLVTALLQLVAAIPPEVLAGIAAGFAALNLGIIPLVRVLSGFIGLLVELAPAIARATPLVWALVLVGEALGRNWDIIVDAAKRLWAAIQENLLPAFQAFWDNIQEGWQNIQPFIQLLGTILRPVLIALAFLLVEVVVPALTLFVQAIGELISWITQLIGWFGQAVNFVIGNFIPAMQQVGAFFSGPFLVPFKAVGAFFAGPFIRFFTETIPRIAAAIGGWVAGAVAAIGRFLASIGTAIANWFSGPFVRFFTEAVPRIAAGIATWAAGAVTAVGLFFVRLALKFGSEVVALGARMVNWGIGLIKDLFTGFINGLVNGGQAVWDKIKDIGGGIVDRFKSIFGIGSPSTVMNQMGLDLNAGLSMGIGAGAVQALTAAAQLGIQVINGLKASFIGMQQVGMQAMQMLILGFQFGLASLLTIVNAFGPLVTSALSAAFNGARTVAVAAMNAIVISVRAGMTNIRAAIIAAQIAPAFSTAFAAARTAVVTAINAIVITVRSGMLNIRTAITAAAVPAAFSAQFTAARAAVVAQVNAIVIAVRSGLANINSAIASSPIRATWQAMWAGMLATAQAVWNQMRAAWQTTANAMVATAQALNTSVVAQITTMGTGILAQITRIQTGINAGWNQILTSTTTAWNNIRNAVVTAINAIVGPINDLIEGFNNVASALDIGTTVPSISIGAAEGGVIPLAHGGVIPGYSAKDRVPAMLRRGEGVLTPGAVSAVGGPAAINELNSQYNHGTGHSIQRMGGFAEGGIQYFLSGGVAAALAAAGVSQSLITQGENSNSPLSAGTHSGLGVIDLGTTSPAVLAALIANGFAAWIRTPAQGFAPHIHAILMSSPGLSPAAQAQVLSFLAGGTGLGVGAGGGLPPLDVGAIFNDLVAGDTSSLPAGMEQLVLSMLTEDIVTSGFADLKSALDGADVGGGMFGESLRAMGDLIYGGIIDTIMSAAEEAQAAMVALAGAAGAGVQQWAALAAQAMAMAGLNPNQLGAFLALMQAESGGNPNAINLTDSNAAAGIPSQGLMQVIPPTFAAYHVAGTSSNILDPLANMAAAAAYIVAVYGGVVPGSPYANGTPGASSGWHLTGERGPEWVKFRGGERVWDAKRTAGGRRGGGGGTNVTFQDGCFKFYGTRKEDMPEIKKDLMPALEMAVKAGAGRRRHG